MKKETWVSVKPDELPKIFHEVVKDKTPDFLEGWEKKVD